MVENWGERVKRYRVRHGLTQERLAVLLGVAQRTVSRWERGEDKPGLDQQRQLRDLDWEPTGALLRSLCHAVVLCPAPRALSRTQNLRLQAVSRPALIKRPSVAEWIGRDLAPIACGVLADMLDDRTLQASIANREIACVLATTRSVLQTAEHAPSAPTEPPSPTSSTRARSTAMLSPCQLRPTPASATRPSPWTTRSTAGLEARRGSFVPHERGVAFLTPGRSLLRLECI